MGEGELQMIKAVVFDFDGLILDTETPWYEAYRGIFRENGHELPVELYAQCVGSTFARFDPFIYLQECLQKPLSKPEIERQAKERYAQQIGGLSLRPGVESYLRSAKELGLKIGLASSSSREWIERYLTKYGIYDFFDCLRTRDDVKNVKPDPELYLRAVECLGVKPEQAVAFEDSENGLKAAKGAGLHCIVFPNPVTCHYQFEGCDGRHDSMADAPFSEVIKPLMEKSRLRESTMPDKERLSND
jgi:putative hydrolase of the HAD superfamily